MNLSRLLEREMYQLLSSGPLQSKVTTLLATTWRQITSAARAFRQRCATAREIERLDKQEVASLAEDLGLRADELRLLVAKDKSAADLLVRRMDTLGLDPAGVDPAVMRDLQRCCSICTDKGRCVH